LAHFGDAHPELPVKILIVEDEPKTGDYLKQGLTEAGLLADLARDGPDGLHLASTGHYDLVILDVMLPGLDGWQVLSRLRQAGRDMPVLFLTARDQVDDRVRGLELGADDYLVKPFAFAELLARVRSLLRRGRNAPESGVLTVADLEMDLLRRRVRAAASGSSSPPRSSPCWNCCCGARARSCPAPSSPPRSGT
jgi:two-component system copper resistance phosphate regulon response regulator CusR